MTRIERTKEKLAALREARAKLIKTGNLLKAMDFDKRISELQAEIDEYEELTRPRLIKELLTPEEIRKSEIITLLTEIHLATDFLVVCQYNLLDVCRQYGMVIEQIGTPLEEIIKRSNEFLSDLMGKNEWLSDVMTENSTLNEAIHKKITSYIRQRSRVPSKRLNKNKTS